MKINRIYSNKPEIFPAIVFHDGLNVVFGQVKDYSDKSKDVHNLGKTFLITVIDFCLLAGVDAKHPFKANDVAFAGFIFFIEIYDNNKRLVIKRSVEKSNRVSIYTGNATFDDFANIPDEIWTYQDITIKDAVVLISDFVQIYPLHPFYNFRKGLNYVMRRQTDYAEVFKTSNFAKSSDSDWKLFVSRMLGLEYEVFDTKYKLDSAIDELEDDAKSLKKMIPKNSRYDEVKSRLEIKEREIEFIRSTVDEYQFDEMDHSTIMATVNHIDVKVAQLNSEVYKIRYEIAELIKSVENDLPFNFDEIIEIFKEVQLYMPDLLIKEYREVENFNRIIYQDRKNRINFTIKEKRHTENDLVAQLGVLTEERNRNLSVLKDTDVFQKHKKYSQILRQKEDELNELRLTFSYLDKIGEKEREARSLKSSRNEIINSLQEFIRNPSVTYKSIKKSFESNVKEVLSVDAILTVDVNKYGNLEPDTKILNADLSRETNESNGTTYRKMMCVCFDLSLIEEYSSSGYYKFLYHDGVLEGLDNRKKVTYLSLVRRLCQTYDFQYIISVIDSDIPRDETDSKKMFGENEIVRWLNDQGNEGRLFKMPPF